MWRMNITIMKYLYSALLVVLKPITNLYRKGASACIKCGKFVGKIAILSHAGCI